MAFKYVNKIMDLAVKRKGFKEPFNAVSHLLGAILAFVGLVALLVVTHGRARPTVAVIIYGTSLIVLYTLSTLYHSLNVSPRHVKRLQSLDHIAIYLLIAGTYTPVCLITLYSGHGLSLFTAVWSIAAVGILAVIFWRKHPEWVRVALYVSMGWLITLVIPALNRAMGPRGLMWLVAGGIAYTSGIFFYAMETRRPKWFRLLTGHEIWHLFVLSGSLCHFILILFFVAPRVS